MNLIIDEGNSSVKVAVFEAQKPIFFRTFAKSDFQKGITREIDFSIITHGIIASVVENAPQRFSFLSEKVANLLFMDAQTPMPFVNNYATPHTLGIDRLALMAAAVTRYPQENVLVIDAGTCITFDVMTQKGIYLGGAIAPGIAMRLRAMHAFTSKLPLLDETDFNTTDFVGNSTKSCMLSGVYNNVVREIEGVITQYEQKFEHLRTILTGGNHLFLVENIKNRIFANSFFLLEGLNAILEWQKK
ncbi:type III pantothenate kinase [Capnocytophaga sp.]|uniref:type III pantothenate kinase n=1 Tax=Capnocytophaga sp. TaxID=44737 RepID=UPI0026DD4A0B|nr:type III pantothenate kinase [Capnocytophaga sp.]MDO5104605.1 type III pantothenate kinase [Capnocytophaga sp.]